MNKNKIISIILKVIAVYIVLHGLWIFYDNRLWRVSTTTYSTYLKIFLPFLTLGFSAILYGIATLLDNNKQ